MRQPSVISTLAAALVGACSGGGSSASNDAGAARCVPGGEVPSGQRVTVGAELDEVSPVMLGVNVNKWFNGANGLWDSEEKKPNATVVAKTTQAGIGLLRFPGGTSANLLRWKRLTGPRAQRSCQIDADGLVPRLERDYGPASFGAVLAATGAEGQVMVPFAVVTPGEAADLVEYMNAPVGTNPNGGVAWAAVRAADGWPDPIGITRWELGNEHDRGNEGYWMAPNDGDPAVMKARRLSQYIDGDEFEISGQLLGRNCNFEQTSSDGSPGQIFYLRWGLIKRGTTPTVTVGATTWTPIADLSQAAATDKVYVLDPDDGTVTFGDGVHGAIPPAGPLVKISYTFHHDGFIAVYRAMKSTANAIGTPIDVCSTWAPVDALGTPYAELGMPSFAEAMRQRSSSAYDCVVIHPYTSFARDFATPWTTARDAHEQTMLGDAHATAMTRHIVEEMAMAGKYAAISEFGALWFGDGADARTSRMNVPTGTHMMSHAVYMASQWLHQRKLGAGWVEGNDLLSGGESLRTVLGPADTGYVFSAEAIVREALAPAFARGSRWLATEASDVERVGFAAQYPAIVSGASRNASGEVRVIIVNRSVEPTTVTIDPGMHLHGTMIRALTTAGASYESAMGPLGDNTVATTETTIDVQAHAFTHRLAPASVTTFAWEPCAP